MDSKYFYLRTSFFNISTAKFEYILHCFAKRICYACILNAYEMFYLMNEKMNSETSLYMMTNNVAENAAKSLIELNCIGCNNRLTELKRQSLRYMLIEYRKIVNGKGKLSLDNLLPLVYKNFRLEYDLLSGTSNGVCIDCGLHVEFLKKQALKFLGSTNIPSNVSKCHKEEKQVSLTNNVSNELESKSKNTDNTSHDLKLNSSRSTASPSAAHFFTEAAKMFNIPNKQNRKVSNKNSVSKDVTFLTNFQSIIKNMPPDNPPGLFKYIGRRVDGKVNVMLRIHSEDLCDSIIQVDQRKKHISIKQPTQLSGIPQHLQLTNASPKLYAFDAIFEHNLSQSKVSATALLDVLHAVINGGDGCLISYGAANVGKTKTMIGADTDNLNLGIIPCAITWLYNLIEDSKQRVGSRISVRISAVEVVGKSEVLKDLLAEQCSGCDSTDSSGGSPGIYLCEDPVGGTVQLGNVSEPQAVNAEKAAFLLDAALEARTKNAAGGGVNFSHMIFTIHVYQYRVDKGLKCGPGGSVPYSGGRSRLHMIDLSSINSNFDTDTHGAAPSHAGLGQIIVAMLNGFKQVPYRDSKITRLLKDSIGSPTCRSTLVAHISDHEKNFTKTCYTLQLTSKISKSRRKKNLNCCTSSDPSSCEESNSRYPNPAMVKTYGIDDTTCVNSDYNTSSAGEDSCDTVIYMGNGHISDRDLSDNEHPPSRSSYLAMKLKLPSSSEDENMESNTMLTNHKKVTCRSIPEQTKKTSEIGSETEALGKLNIKIGCQPRENVEKVVNVVAPLIVKNENKLSNDEAIKLSSFKEIRKQEKRIAKLLNSFDNETQRSNGYKSDTENKVVDLSCKIVDGYISAPENYKYKPVQIVKGTVRQSKDIFVSSNLEKNISCKIDKPCDFVSCKNLNVSNVLNKLIPETNLDELLNGLQEQQSSINNLKELSVDSPIKATENSLLTSCRTCENEVIEKKEKQFKICQNKSNDLKNQTYKIENLDHIISISTVPNFSVTKKPLSSIASPKFDRMLKTVNTFSSENNNQQKFPPKHFYARSYSKEDTISLSSINDSDDSDVASLCLSPASSRKQHPARLRYRWSTVFEEEEIKKQDKQYIKNNNQEIIVTLESEPRSGQSLLQKSNAVVTDQASSFLFSTPLSEQHIFKTPKSSKKFSLLSPKSDRKILKSKSENRMSAYSDSSSGIGSLNSQSSSLKSREEIKVLNDEKNMPQVSSKSKFWLFSRSFKKTPKVSGYLSDGNVTYSSYFSSRSKKFFGSRSKVSHNESGDGGHSSGYDTSITDGGTTSCAEDLTDNEGNGAKKKKRFLGFRRRLVNSSNVRIKKPLWLPNRHCQSDDEGMQIKVYEIDDPQKINKRPWKSQGGELVNHCRINELDQHHKLLKSLSKYGSNCVFDYSSQYPVELENKVFSTKLKTFQKNIQVVTCFDGSRKTTRI
ncbi:kinesin-related protein 10 isoform X7 [Hydra vulgaris]|uniref:Kinesin-related protein 10 isoform X7 n=2 Tax=Hydra vulgaris TaxID=6087 RepID=A0ABM4C352_HYDVU